MKKVFIDGSEGTTGLKLKRRLQGRDDIELLSIDRAKRKNIDERIKMINASDITVLCLPDAASIEAVSFVQNNRVKIIDCSTAHRTNPDWAYGFPELAPSFREAIKESKRIALPGCYASGFNAIVYPLVKAGIIAPDYPITCYAISGYTGAGKKGIAQYEIVDRSRELDAPRQYALSQEHKHLKEMTAIPALERVPFFAPHICDYRYGMVVSVPLFADMMEKRMTPGELQQFFAAHYAGEPIVKVRELHHSDNMIGANNFAKRDDMELEVNGNDERILITTRFDNLGKGASGAAIQLLNLVMGVEDETKGLTLGD